jgi:hypothetical protein
MKEWDVITQIGGVPIDSDGKVAIRYDLRLSASYLVQKYAKNGLLPITVFRDGKLIQLNLPARSNRDLVIPYLLDAQPRFLFLVPSFSHRQPRITSNGWAINGRHPLAASQVPW